VAHRGAIHATWRRTARGGDYPPTSIAQIAETILGKRRLVVRRVRTLNAQGELLPSWELFPFLTDRTEPLVLVEAEHRQHAVVELAIRDSKTRPSHFPSGQFTANAAWTDTTGSRPQRLPPVGNPRRRTVLARLLRRRPRSRL
jgi:hypothetical protein